MKGKYIAGIVMCFALILSACISEGNAEAEVDEVEDQNTEEETEIQEDEFEPLSNEEAKEIVQSTLDELMGQTVLIKEENIEWYALDFSDESSDEVSAAVGKTNERLDDLATEKFMDQFTAYYLEAYYCDCDAYELPYSKKAAIAFEVVEQDENHFKGASITLGNDMNPGPGATYLWSFEKEADQWKIDDITAVSAKEQPINLTFDDLTNSYEDSIELVDEVERDGERFIVIKHVDNEHYVAYSAMTGELNYVLADEYREAGEVDAQPKNGETTDQRSNQNEESEKLYPRLSNPTQFIHKYEEYETEFDGLGKTEIKIPLFGIDGLDQHLYEQYFAANEVLPDYEDVNPTKDTSEFSYVDSRMYHDYHQHGRFVTVLMNSYLYEDGVNGMYFTRNINYDLEKERPFELRDLLNAKNISLERLDELVKEKLKGDNYKGALFPDYESNLDSPALDYQVFYATDYELSIIFNIYQIGPRSSGTLVVSIPWEEF